jgi:hypothetical protein
MMFAPRQRRWMVCGAMALTVALTGTAMVQAVGMDPSGRYYLDGSGKPVFLTGYYAWASPVDGYYIDHPSRYADMMNQGAPYKINYIRIALGFNRETGSTNPPSYNGQPTPAPFLFVDCGGGTYKANLTQPDDSIYWTGLKNQCTLARDNGVIVHISIFDGVGMRSQGGADYGYHGSCWNPANQCGTFYPDPDLNHNGQIDDPGEFYRATEFNNGNPTAGTISYYQKQIIDKVTTELAGYDNVFFEVGNELMGSDAAWNTAVIGYIQTKTAKPVTSCAGPATCCLQGWSQHTAGTLAELKTNLGSIVGHGYPAWEDPDGSGLCTTDCAAPVSPDTLRRAAWYSFAGGAACWGGFTTDFWTWPCNPPPGFNATTALYYRNLQEFIAMSSVPFADMVPQQGLVGNNTVNLCLARSGSNYLAYILNDGTASVDLSAVNGRAYYELYDPRAGTFSSPGTVAGGAVRSFSKPAGADDWVIYVYKTLPLGQTYTLGAGHTPGVATDSRGNIHVVLMNGATIYYRKYLPNMAQALSETIPAPPGYTTFNRPHVVCDSSGAPQVVFTGGTMPYSDKIWYTNRTSGSWKEPVAAMTEDPTVPGDSVGYPRLVLLGSYAFVSSIVHDGVEPGGIWGRINRLSNLSTAPTVDGVYAEPLPPSIPGYLRCTIAANGAGHIVASGRNNADGHYCQEYDQNLTPTGSLAKWSSCTGKTNSPSGICGDRNGNVHMFTDGIYGSQDRCQMVYNRRNPDGTLQCCVTGMNGGGPGTGPNPLTEPTGWWNDEVWPVCAVDTLGRVHVAYTGWTNRPLSGLVTAVDCNGFVEPPTAFAADVNYEGQGYNCEIAPALDRGVYVVWQGSDGNCYLRGVGVGTPGKPAGLVSDDLGNPDVANGLTLMTTVSDGDTTPVTMAGRVCRRNTDPNATQAGDRDYYFYFNVRESFMYAGSQQELWITLDYLDNGASYANGSAASISLNYDSNTGSDIPAIYKSGGSVVMTGDPGNPTWKHAVFHVTDAYFGNRQNGGADFRFGCVGPYFYVDKVTVLSQAPLPPVIDPVVPTSKTAFVGESYVEQLTLSQGYPAPTWSVLQGPPGLHVTATGDLTAEVSGWTPLPGDLATRDFAILVQASNNEPPPGQVSWTVRVISRKDFDGDGDVDQSDFGVFQRCLSGPGTGYGQGCAPTDLDGNGAVDQTDFSMLWECLSGPDQTPRC